MNPAIELNDLNDVIQHYIASDTLDNPAVPLILRRFGKLLVEQGLDDGSIMLQDHWALFYEARGDLPRAIAHREREIQLVERLFTIGAPAGPVNVAFLRNVRQILHRHYLARGEHEKADALLSRIQSSE